MALLDQTLPRHRYEIVVVDDGSSDGTGGTVASVASIASADIRYFRQEKNKGPAAARNVGIDNARGRVILFIGDDVVATLDLLEEHLTWHERFPDRNVAVLGYTTWSTDIPVTPFMRWLEDGGPQFKYSTIVDPFNVPWTFFYTSNISAKTSFLLGAGAFDEDFPYAAYEDLELGYRLSRKGLRIVYNRQAVGFHHHYTTIEDALARMVRVGVSRRIFERKVIGAQRRHQAAASGGLRGGLAELKYSGLRILGRVLADRCIVRRLYAYLLDKAQSDGYERTIREESVHDHRAES